MGDQTRMKPRPERPDWLYHISYGLADGAKLRVLLENERYAIVQEPGGMWWDNSGGHYGASTYWQVDKTKLETYRKSVGLLDCKEIQHGGRPKLAQWKKLIEEDNMAEKRVSKYLIEILLVQFLRDMGITFDPKAPSHLAAMQKAMENYENTK